MWPIVSKQQKAFSTLNIKHVLLRKCRPTFVKEDQKLVWAKNKLSIFPVVPQTNRLDNYMIEVTFR